ncbi:MAG: tetratricopeptide (TPR) repeat protein [Maribacter sp.]|jgi:tetratricopeptide (TPR) repeat protein
MRIITTVLCCLTMMSITFGQTLDSLEVRLDTSKIEYIVLLDETVITPLQRSEPLPDILCRQKVNGNNKTTYFRLYGENDINFNKAEQEMDTMMYAEAREKYLVLLDSFPGDTYLMTRVGYSYEKENELKKAKEWYQKSLDGNNIAFDTRERMAKILVQSKKTKKEALEHIIKASIINRNDESVEKMLRIVAQANKSKYVGWEFEPLAIVAANPAKDTVNIDIRDKVWEGYALSLAAYLFEPNYKEEVVVRTKELLTVTPYRESLMILYKTIRKKKVKNPMLKALKKAVEMDLLEEFMMYEIFLPLDAYSFFVLDDSQKERIYTYVKEVKLWIKK